MIDVESIFPLPFINKKNKSHSCKYDQFVSMSDANRVLFVNRDNSKSNQILLKEQNTKVSIKDKRNIGSQTVYRDESTQTDPFSPVYSVSNGEHPEVLMLSDFIYGKGLPASSVEISFIERLRARREWAVDHTKNMARTKIVIEREMRQWQTREKEIKRLQEARHTLFTQNLHHYVELDEDLMQYIIDTIIDRKEKQIQIQQQRLEVETLRNIRRMKRTYRLRERQINAVTSAEYLGVIGAVHRGDGCYVSLKPPWYSRSHNFATTRFTSAPRSHATNLHQIDIAETEVSLPRTSRSRKVERQMRTLDKAQKLIDEEKSKKSSVVQEKPLRFVEKIDPVDSTDPMEILSTSTKINQHTDTSIIKLQNYLRGIMVQSKVDHVRQIRHDLLEELRQEPNANQPSTAVVDLDQNKNQQRNALYEQLCDYIEGVTLADMLDFLSKELIRLQSEQMIHLFLSLADRYRYQREATETGNRSKIIEQQNILEEILLPEKSITDIDHYLENLILQSISDTADEQARLEIQEFAQKLMTMTDEINHAQLTENEIESRIAELVHIFLLPTVQKFLNRHQSKRAELRYLNASHRTCHDQWKTLHSSSNKH